VHLVIVEIRRLVLVELVVLVLVELEVVLVGPRIHDPALLILILVVQGLPVILLP